MKTFQSVPVFLIAILFFVSCEKEMSLENGNSILSSGTLKSSATGDCLPSTINGIYKAATPLLAGNYLDVQVNVTDIGNYTIYSDTINGFAFKAQGNFSVTGINTVRLLGSGTPIAAGINNFSIRYGTSICVFAVTVFAATAPDAIYNFSAATNGDCAGAVLSGVYNVGTPAGISNVVTLALTVTTAGVYNISTPAVNGISFSGSGAFTTTGVQNVTLTASGTPAVAGSFNSVASIGTSTCTFSVTATAGNTVAVYTLGGAGSNCTGVTLAGTYTSGIAMIPANTSRVDVNVTAIGTYTISTAAVNGVSFAASGSFTNTGSQQITLTAIGTPIAAGINNFAVSGGGASCNFSVTFAAPAAPAAFTLAGAPGACISPAVNGSYQALTPLTSGNTVSIKVDVTSVGSYSITTNTVNGISFSASGVFAATGLGIVVTLAGTGTPLAAGTTTLTPSVGTSGCTFDIVIAAAPTGIFNCKIDGVYTSFDDRAVADVFDEYVIGAPVPWLYLDGFTSPGNGGFVPELQIFITKNDNSTVMPGTYNENNWIPPGTYRIEIDLHLENPDQSVTIWNTSSNFLPPPNPPFTIIVTSRTATRVKGTFSGQVTNLLQGSTALKTITAGVFDLPIQ